MNISTYIFGKLGRGYSQYPDDYTSNIFKVFVNNGKAKTQIAIHRDNDLMYYGYIRNLEDDCYIGLCVVINGHYIVKLDNLFDIFEKEIELMVRNGYFIHYNDQGEIVSSSLKIKDDKDAIREIGMSLVKVFGGMKTMPLPSVNYGSSSNSVKSFSVEDDSNDVVSSSYCTDYTFLYKSRGYDTYSMLGYKGAISRLKNNIEKLNKDLKNRTAQIESLQAQLAKQKQKQRNVKWVTILAIIAIILGTVVWNKVLFPNEVTKYDAGEFLYYGPIRDGKPNGTGVAIYPKNDRDKRLYYYGNFFNGNRVDTDAIMFYQNGSYFKGSMRNDQWYKGLLYDVEGEHFVGEFRNNRPYIGTWYKHVKAQEINGNGNNR